MSETLKKMAYPDQFQNTIERNRQREHICESVREAQGELVIHAYINNETSAPEEEASIIINTIGSLGEWRKGALEHEYTFFRETPRPERPKRQPGVPYATASS